KLTTIMDFAYENGDTWVGYDIGVAQQELMRGRFYHERYLITNDPETFTTALSFMDAAIRNIKSLSPRLYDPTMQELAGQAVEEISAYILSAQQNYDVLVMRNEVRDHKLDTLGPEIKNELEQLLHSVVDRQRALGSRASQGSEVTLISVLVLSTIAISLGIFLAVFVGRHISRRICAMAETMNQLAEGDLHIEIGDKDQRHELGMMARALEVFRFNAQELEKALQKERELNGLQRQFVSMVSHEFRTPLAIIDANAQHLSRRQDRISADRVKKALATIRKSVVRLTDLMESVLSAARMEDGKIAFDPAEFDLHEMITEVCRNYAEISESHAIITDLNNVPTRYVGDVKLLRQVVSNLISNAVKYSPDKDSVFVSGKTNQDGTIVIAFRDEGVGIPGEELEKLFERFFRASTSTGIPGSGIGLHLVSHIVELHEGTLTVTSDVGKGSVFELHLQMAKAESGPEVEAERPKQLETLDDLLCIE
ncbi:MAG: HAMP domain-containing sensor histidine kinase, partial [Pseudomonadota bacterium]